MNLTEHYNELYKTSIEKIKNGDYQTDSLIDSPNDKRFGITLLIRPPEKIKKQIQLILKELNEVDASQYYYPNSDIHITVISIIYCYEGFQLDRISISDYKKLIRKSIKGLDRFSIKFQGITASDSGIMIQGFPQSEILSNLRNKLRTSFKNSDLEQSIDQRYTIQTAHSTILRFRNELQNSKELFEVIKKYKEFEFGNFEVSELELVFNDWYQRKSSSILLEKFEL
jgi:2'-5' RNA ligase